MDKIFEESGLSFNFTESLCTERVDIQTYHDLPDVDFVVETEENFLLIEVKNPDTKKSNEPLRNAFHKDLETDLLPYKISDKYKCTLMRKWVKGEFYRKPIRFILILELKRLLAEDRAELYEKIYNRLPFSFNKPKFQSIERFESFEIMTVNEFVKSYPEFDVREDSYENR